MFNKTWSGDWHARVLERARQHGFSTVTEYAAKRVGVGLLELANELGPDDIAATQIVCLLIEEAVRADAVPRMMRDLLVRELREALPHGWKPPLDETSRSEIAGAIARWHAELGDYVEEQSTIEAGRSLLSAELPAGWLPEGPDDPVIVAFVDRCLGRAPS